MKYASLIFLFCCVLSCRQNDSINKGIAMNTDSMNEALLNVDRSWSALSLSKGYYHSRLSFVADHGIEMMQNAMPLIGKKGVEEFTASHADSAFTMQWKPMKALVASSGDLGYTYGSWIMNTKTKTGKDTSLFGTYITVWQKQADGSWKYIMDGGNDTPGEVRE